MATDMTAVLATEAWQIISHTENTVEDHLRARMYRGRFLH